jgi:hypothetical protein
MLANREIGGVRVPCTVFYIIAVIAIFVYGWYKRKMKSRDFLETKIVGSLDGWSLTHLFFWFGIGFIYPDHYMQCLIISMLWEGFETVLGTTKIQLSGVRLQLIGATDENGYPIDCTDAEDAFWYGRISDIGVNLLGMAMGSKIGRWIWPPKQNDNVFWPGRW